MAAVKDYSVEEKLKALVKLQKIDSKLDETKILKGELPVEVSDLEDEITGFNNRKHRIEEEINGINDYIESRRQAIKDSAELVGKYEKQSESVKNSREFDAINKEIEMQQLEGKLAEKHIKDANEELADKVRSLEAVKKQIGNKETALTQKKSELDKIVAETEIEENHYRSISDDARKNIDERLQYSYDRIRKSYRNGLAVVPVLRDACGGCFNSIPPQKQSEIRQHKKIIICENCGRILVDEELNNSVEIN
jgi:predicted  nucleic acid-binding Zn-ribbon protein